MHEFRRCDLCGQVYVVSFNTWTRLPEIVKSLWHHRQVCPVFQRMELRVPEKYRYDRESNQDRIVYGYFENGWFWFDAGFQKYYIPPVIEA